MNHSFLRGSAITRDRITRDRINRPKLTRDRTCNTWQNKKHPQKFSPLRGDFKQPNSLKIFLLLYTVLYQYSVARRRRENFGVLSRSLFICPLIFVMKFQHKKQIAQNVSKIFTQLQMQCVTGIDFLVSKETLFLIISVNCRCPPPGYFWMVPSCRRRDFFVSARRRRNFFTILDDQMHSELTKCRGFSMDLDLEIPKISPTGGLSAIPMISPFPEK